MRWKGDALQGTLEALEAVKIENKRFQARAVVDRIVLLLRATSDNIAQIQRVL